EASFQCARETAPEKAILCFLHYPPIYQGYQCPELLNLIDRYYPERCYYGHLHGATHRRAFEGRRNATDYALISADYLGFNPKKICE
ncbi:MAG: serine/threonine protein phosphatase, partial [Oscillospiraceae bacterium]|nr:serine/threonine protein phosphatase [Oscillospiraceae bacterium]